MADYVEAGGLKVAAELHDFVETRALPGTGIESAAFWEGFGKLVADFAPRNRALVAKRAELQRRIDDWHRENPGQPDPQALRAFLSEIGYLVPEGGDFAVDTPTVDDEFAKIAGPQLVVPVTNARYALNAANARWGSLYDALYGTDALGDRPAGGGYDARRGERVVAWAKDFLDRTFPLERGSHGQVERYAVAHGRLVPTLEGGDETGLKDAGQFAGYRGEASAPQAVLLVNNHLHVEIVIDADSQVGSQDKAGVADMVVESAITTIMDCEDSVAAVDAEDKVLTYSNWLGLMAGDLETEVAKGDGSITRRLDPDREYAAPDGSTLTLPGRSLMLVRNVGPLMTNPAVLTADGEEVPEELIDGAMTTLCALHDIRKGQGPRNSRTGSVYIVKPKMHGPEEVAYTNELMARVEELLGLSGNTIKLGIMDEERRTT
ncbi:MAG TPA: malate synthase G, partial [Thermohalobaculum sp.]|nr:malate synthase G [Thermohalobaculum sp.]